MLCKVIFPKNQVNHIPFGLLCTKPSNNLYMRYALFWNFTRRFVVNSLPTFRDSLWVHFQRSVIQEEITQAAPCCSTTLTATCQTTRCHNTHLHIELCQSVPATGLFVPPIQICPTQTFPVTGECCSLRVTTVHGCFIYTCVSRVGS